MILIKSHMGVMLAQLVKASVGQADVQRFDPHLLSCGVFLVKSRQFGLPLAQTLRPNWQSLLADGLVAIQTWSIYKVYARGDEDNYHSKSERVITRLYFTLLKVTIENVCTRSFHISGLYFPSSRKDIPAEYRGIGVRIEDDVLITSDSYENLTASCPKSVTDIEKLMNSK